MQTPQKKVRFVFALFAMRNCGCVKAAKTVRISLTSRIPIVSMGKTRITNRNGISACRSTSPGRHVKCVLSMMKLAKFTLQMSFSKRQIQCLNSNIALFLRMSSKAELFSISRMGEGSCGSSTRVPNLKIAPLGGSVMTRISAVSESRSISGCADPGNSWRMGRTLSRHTTSTAFAYAGHLRISPDGEIDLSQKARMDYGWSIPPRIVIPEFTNREFLRWLWENYTGF